MLCQIFLVLLAAVGSCRAGFQYNEFTDDFIKLNEEVLSVNHQNAQLAWDTNFDPRDPKKAGEVQDFADKKRKWLSAKCSEMKGFWPKFHTQQKRIFEVLCHGPKYSGEQQKKLIDLSNLVEQIFTSTRLCVPKTVDICRHPEKLWNFTFIQTENDLRQLTFDPDDGNAETQPQNVFLEDLICFKGEPDLENLMANDFTAIPTRDDSFCAKNKNLIDYWIWEAWRLAVGPVMKPPYLELVELMNEGAKNSKRDDIGEIWKDEMELGDDVEGLMKRLMEEVQPLYNMLHAFTKSLLEKKNHADLGKNIPAHVLGWNANWNHLFTELVEPEIFDTSSWNMEKAMKTAKWEPNELMKRVEDFYTSTGLPRMTRTFWNKSSIGGHKELNCHGTSADMIHPDDFRIIVCGCKSLYDFYVIVHEMGHIEQYMLAQNQNGVFRAGNSVLQETIGDVFFLSIMTPMHLNRLRLIEDELLFPSYNNDFDLHQLMMMAFMKLPEIPFGYVFEKFRYDLFAGRVGDQQSNDYFWDLTRKHQRVEPPNLNTNRHQLFDASAKFHLAANVPYARYFFANILQYQVFEALCKKTFFGKLTANQTVPLPLHKCDIYGSKRAGSLLKRALQPGSSISLQNALLTLTGSENISTTALLEYYSPLIRWLETYLAAHKIEY